jgi:HK97 family phage prohead protease
MTDELRNEDEVIEPIEEDEVGVEEHIADDDEERDMETCDACDGTGDCAECGGDGVVQENSAPEAEAEREAPEIEERNDDELGDDAAITGGADDLPAPTDGTEKQVCPTCEGAGSIVQGSDEEPGDGDLDDAVCPECNGSGEIDAVVETDGGGVAEDATDDASGNAAGEDGGEQLPAEEQDVIEYDTAEPVKLEAKIGRTDDKPLEIRRFEQRFGELGAVERRDLSLGKPEIRDSGAGSDTFTVKGHASVFNKESLDLGWFTEFVDPGAFDRVLSEDPDVFFLQDHNTLLTLARTKNGTLDLATDDVGLAYWARVNGALSYAADLRIALEDGLIDQASFAFTVARDRWEDEYDEDGNWVSTVRTILEIGELYDVTVCAMGAYPDTDSELVRSIYRDYAHARIEEQEKANAARARLKLRAKEVAQAEGPNPTVARAKLHAKARRARISS